MGYPSRDRQGAVQLTDYCSLKHLPLLLLQ